ncbi:MAG: low specificity L-threonine aldolase [Pseudomonadota bacterium]
MLFGSDNWAGAAPEIMQSLEHHSSGYAVAYGDGDLDKRVEETFCDVFETECRVYFVGTGTAANSLAFASVMRPGGVAFCHAEAHMTANEGGAPEFATGGGRLCLVDGELGKISPDALSAAVAGYPQHFNHLGQGTLVTLTQSTEGGTCYSLEELSAISAIAKQHGLALHMDGARFANALVDVGCSPAEMTWKNGVDMVSFGATKNGCWCAEALVVFNPEIAKEAEFVRKQMGHLFSKTRFVTAQFQAYFEGDLWLKLARHSNSIGNALEKMVSQSNRIRLAWPSKTNQIFFIAKRSEASVWLEAGARFHPFPTPRSLVEEVRPDEQVYRLVASYISTQADVENLSRVIHT